MAAPTIVQSAGQNSAGSVASLAKAFGSNVTAGNLIVVTAACWHSLGRRLNVDSVSDSDSNTYTNRDGAVGAPQVRIWTAVAANTGPLTVTIKAFDTAGNPANDNLGIGIHEVAYGGDLTFLSNIKSTVSSTAVTSNDVEPTTDALLIAAMVCLGNPLSITEEAGWSLLIEDESFANVPWSSIYQAASAGTHDADWTLGASITTMSAILSIEHTGSPIKGSAVFGVNTTVTATRAIAFGLDGATNVHDEAGKFKVFGDFEVTGVSTLPGVGDVEGPAASVDGEVALFDGTTGKLLKRASATGVAKVTAGVLSAANVNLASEVTGDLPLANLAQASAASKLLGRGDSGAGDYEEVTLGAGLSMSGTTLFPAVRTAEVEISSAELLALRATPKTLVAAPGAGKVLEFVSAVLILDATATAYVESSANLGIKYTNGSGVQVSETIEATGFIDQTSDTMTTVRAKLDNIVAKTGCENAALVIHNLGAGEYTTGTGVMRVKMSFRVWTTGW